MRRFFRWLFRKSLNPPAEVRDEPDTLQKARSEYRAAKREQDGALRLLRRIEEAVRKH